MLFWYFRGRPLAVSQKAMRLRPAVPKTPPKSSHPPHLPFCKGDHPLTRSESTLLQLLIRLHFISRRMNVYKKLGGGCPSSSPKVLQLATTHASPHSTHPCRRNPFSLIHLRTLSVTHGVYHPLSTLHTQSLPYFSTANGRLLHSGARNSIPFLHLFHTSLYTGWGHCPFLSRSSFAHFSASGTIFCSPGSRRMHDRYVQRLGTRSTLP